MSDRRPSQREVMRALYKDHRGMKADVCAAYAAAEKRGEVERKSNEHNAPPEIYARKLFVDGIRRGWLP
jgi:hypothetical protein